MSSFIIFLENADPGYDWIFARNPMGIVTKYGGVASHMAIRCAEFGIPAAIGCGSTIYNNLVKSNFVVIDGAKQALEHLEG
jgi:phosphoenolpyruvate-protein kinase (PTS system EI component)